GSGGRGRGWGGSEGGGRGGVRVGVRSAAGVAPAAIASAKDRRSGVLIVLLAELALERLGIGGEPRTDVLRHVADEHLLEAPAQRPHGGRGARGRHPLGGPA